MKFDELQKLVLKLGALGDVPEKYLQIFNTSVGDGTPHIICHENEYDYIVAERGVSLSIKKFLILDDLLFHILLNAVEQYSYDSELVQRDNANDPRRFAFKKLVQTMNRIKPKWGLRANVFIEEILQTAPFCDGVESAKRQLF